MDYDLGPNGFAYYDKDTADYHLAQPRSAGNRGRVYRNDGVDIRKDAALYESYYVSDIEEGEWLQFTINLTQKGNYSLELTTAAANDSGRITILVNNKSLAEKTIPNTGDLQNFKPFTVQNIPLAAGLQVFRIYFVAGGFNFKSVKFITAN